MYVLTSKCFNGFGLGCACHLLVCLLLVHCQMFSLFFVAFTLTSLMDNVTHTHLRLFFLSFFRPTTESKNYVHEDENWRQRVDREGMCSTDFWDTWGFMCLDPSKAATRRNYTARLVKYFDTHGGTWTVESKRVPNTKPVSEFLNQDDDEVARDVIEGRQTAQFSATNSHKKMLKGPLKIPRFSP